VSDLEVDQYVECRAPNRKKPGEDIIFWGTIIKIVGRPGDDIYDLGRFVTVRPVWRLPTTGGSFENREVTEDRIQKLNILQVLALAAVEEDEIVYVPELKL